MYVKLDSFVDISPFDMKYLNTVGSLNMCVDEHNRQAFKTGMKTAIVLRSRKVKDYGVNGLVRLLSWSSDLKVFQLSETEISVYHCSLVTDCLSGLHYIHLLEVNFERLFNLEDLQLWKICDQQRQLTKLNLFGCEKLTDVGLRSVSTFCMSLRWLHVGKLPLLTDTFIDELGTNCCQLSNIFLGQCPTLFSERSLQGLFTTRAESLIEISISGIVRLNLVTHIGNHCHNLTILDLTGSMVVLDPGVESICIGCTKLTALNVSNIIHMDFFHFVQLLSSFPYLSRFTFAGVNGKFYNNIYHLLSLKFSSFTHIDTLNDCVVGFPIIPCPSLMNTLDYTMKPSNKLVYYSEWYKNIDMCVSLIACKCRNSLGSLKLSGDLRMNTLLTLFPLKDGLSFLSRLSLVGLKYLSDDKLCDVSYLCANVSSFSVINCSLISSTGIISVCHNCSSIEQLSLSGFETKSSHDDGIICDQAFTVGVSQLMSLKSLNLSTLRYVTECGLQKVVGSCKKLHGDVTVFNCGVSQDLVDKMFG
jgi:hypothetical protein